MDLRNQSAVVTGGASGMGAVTASALAARGARVAVLDINQTAAQDKADEFGGVGIACDVADAQSAASAVERVVAEIGPPRVVVNCAGIALAGRIVGRDGPHDLGDYQKVISVNLIGTFNVLRLTAATMSELEVIGDSGGRGVIINTASVAAYDGQIGQAAYSSSKGGVVALTLPAARELARFGIRVMTIAPGLIKTPMLSGLPNEVQESLADQVPFPRRLGEPEEYASLVEHIVDNEMLNGEVIRLDGAIRMQSQ